MFGRLFVWLWSSGGGRPAPPTTALVGSTTRTTQLTGSLGG